MRTFLSSLAVLLALAGVMTVPSPAAAQEPLARPDFSRLSFAPAPATTTGRVASFDLAPSASSALSAPEASRPSRVLTSLYAATVVTQSLDVHSTMSALNAGAVERNPAMSYLTSHPSAFAAIKAGTAAGIILAARSLAKKNKKQAVIALVAVNSAYAIIAAHNYRVAHKLKTR